MSAIKFTKIIPQFAVPDVVMTAEYYREMLGFSILGYFAEPPVYAMIERDGIEIHFGKGDGDSVEVNETSNEGLGSDAYIFVSDVGALHKELTEKGVDIIDGPITRVYGCTEITVRDCNGFRLVFAESS